MTDAPDPSDSTPDASRTSPHDAPSDSSLDGSGQTTPRPSVMRRHRRRSLREDAVNLPNLLTMARIVVIPIFLVFLDRNTPRDGVIAALIYTAAAFTDFLDGWLARRMGVVSVLGKFLDPLADKLIVMAALIWSVPMGRVPAWLVVVLLTREISVTGLRSVAASEGVVIAAGAEGKTKTALQMTGVVCMIIGFPYRLSYLGIDLGVVDVVKVGLVLLYLSLVFSLASAAQYTKLFGEAVDAKTRRQTLP